MIVYYIKGPSKQDDVTWLSIDPWQNHLIIYKSPFVGKTDTQTPVALMPKQSNSQLSVERSNLCS
jgi:hypothetical protein